LIGAIESSVEPADWSTLVAAGPAGPGTWDVTEVPAPTIPSIRVGCGFGAGLLAGTGRPLGGDCVRVPLPWCGRPDGRLGAVPGRATPVAPVEDDDGAELAAPG
jgi:hypothetical protein